MKFGMIEVKHLRGVEIGQLREQFVNLLYRCVALQLSPPVVETTACQCMCPGYDIFRMDKKKILLFTVSEYFEEIGPFLLFKPVIGLKQQEIILESASLQCFMYER
jgi:hypothetical protein